MSATSTKNKKCTYCGSLIDNSASLCPVCTNYQSRSRNAILHLGGAAGLITVIASGLLFSIEKCVQLYHNFHWSDMLSIHYFHTYPNGHYNLTLSNKGSGNVLVSEITIYYDVVNNYPFYIGKVVASGEFLTLPNLDVPTELIGLDGGYAKNDDGKPSNDILNNASITWNKGSDKCYAILFINSEAEDIHRMNSAFAAVHKRLITSPSEAKIVYFDGRTGKRFEQPFSAVATYVLSSEPRCKLGR